MSAAAARPDPPPASDPAPRLLDLAGGAVAVTDEGPAGGPTVVCAHGIPGSVRDFRYLAPPLVARGVRVVRVDLPGFGGSAPRADAIDTLHGRARVLLQVADTLRLSRFATLGHSMGGAAALLAADGAPRRVSHLVLLSSVGLHRHRGLGLPSWIFGAMARAHAVPVLGHALAPLSRAQYRRRRFPGVDAMTRADFALQMRAIAALDFRPLRDAVQAPTLPPVLVAWAADDHLVEPWISEELAATARARRVVFDTGGHNIQKTRAEELAAAIAAFVR